MSATWEDSQPIDPLILRRAEEDVARVARESAERIRERNRREAEDICAAG